MNGLTYWIIIAVAYAIYMTWRLSVVRKHENMIRDAWQKQQDQLAHEFCAIQKGAE